MKRVTVLGSTGSVGKQTLEIVRRFSDDFEIVGLSAFSNGELLAEQIEDFNAKYFYLENGDISPVNGAKKVSSLSELAKIECDLVVCAVTGLAGLEPSLAALEQGTNLATANKEAMVCGGKLMWQVARKSGAKILPVDSEHSAIWQCMFGEKKENLKKVYITASGGALRDKSKAEIEKVRAKEALYHPVWNMGKKITIDSATLFNKGLEVIEAVNLFEISPEQVEVLLHPQSIVHAMCSFKDNSFKASLAYPDMLLPIELAMFYPDRGERCIQNLDFVRIRSLEFFEIDNDRFPCLKIALNALKCGQGACCAISSADEFLVDKYLRDEIKFYDISDNLQKVLYKFAESRIDCLSDAFEIDKQVKAYLKGTV